jgi:hypothetical protein
MIAPSSTAKARRLQNSEDAPREATRRQLLLVRTSLGPKAAPVSKSPTRTICNAIKRWSMTTKTALARTRKTRPGRGIIDGVETGRQKRLSGRV